MIRRLVRPWQFRAMLAAIAWLGCANAVLPHAAHGEAPIAPSPDSDPEPRDAAPAAPGATPAQAPARLPPPVALDRDAPAAAPAERPSAALGFSPFMLAVLAAACIGAVALRIARRRRDATLPPDVFAVLGEASLGGPHAVRIVRFGPKTLLVALSSGGCRTLAEVSDPQATAVMVAACRGAHPAHAPRPAAAAGRAAAAILVLALATTGLSAAPAFAADAAPTEAAGSAWGEMFTSMLGARSLDATLSAALMFGVASLAPAVLLMTTSFVRISVVLSLLRQGLGTQQLPSNQIVTSLALFLSALVMWPVWTQAWRAGVEPYQQGRIGLREAYEQGTLPVRRWMAGQIEQAGNRDTMLLFLERHPDAPKNVKTYDDVPVESLLPAFLVSELETAFAIGFRLLLPFLVLDLVVATLVVSTGLVMLPPTLVSLPLKLLVFVMADGWALVVQSLLDGLRTGGP